MSKNNFPSDNLYSSIVILQEKTLITGPTGPDGLTGPVSISGAATVNSLVSFSSSSQIKNVSDTLPVITSLGDIYFNSTNVTNRNIFIGSALTFNNTPLRTIAIGNNLTFGATVGNNNVIISPSTSSINISSIGMSNSTLLNVLTFAGTGGARVFAANTANITNPGTRGIFINTSSNLSFLAGTSGHFYIHTGLGTASGGVNESQMIYETTTGRISRQVSSRRFKTNIEDLDDTRVNNIVSALVPKTYNFIESNNPSVGLIAEDVYPVLPEICSLDEEGEPFSVRYDLLSVVLLSKIKMQQAVIDDLISRVTALE